jgi:hypothetical protein
VTPSQGKPFTVEKANQQAKHYVLANIPKGKSMKSESVADAMARMVNGLRLLDVQKAENFDAAKDSKGSKDKAHAVKAEFQTFDGLIITADIHNQDKHAYVTLAARFDPSVRPAPPAAAKDKKDGDKKADAKTAVKTIAKKTPDPHAKPLKDASEVQEEAAKLSERLQGWVFRIADSKVSALNKTAADLLKDS